MISHRNGANLEMVKSWFFFILLTVTSLHFTVMCHENVSRQENTLSSYCHPFVISIWRVFLEPRDKMSGNITDAYDNPLNACFNSHHSFHFTVTGRLSYICQPFPSAKHEAGFDWASSRGTSDLHLHVTQVQWWMYTYCILRSSVLLVLFIFKKGELCRYR